MARSWVRGDLVLWLFVWGLRVPRTPGRTSPGTCIPKGSLAQGPSSRWEGAPARFGELKAEAKPYCGSAGV